MKQFHRLITLVATLVFLAGTGSALAAVIDFEGIAPVGSQTTENGTTNAFAGFDVFVPHGHYVDAGQLTANRPQNGTDWLLHDHFNNTFGQPVVVTRSGGGVFSVQSIDASEWENTFPLGQMLTLTGHFMGGGNIVANFITDNLFGFETFAVPVGFTNLVALDIIGSDASGFGSCAGANGCGSLAYDNIVVTPGNVVPEPGTLALLGLGLGFIGLARRRRHSK